MRKNKTTETFRQITSDKNLTWMQRLKKDLSDNDINSTFLLEATYEYIGDITQQLLAVANANKQNFLAYHLRAAAEEAHSMARRMRLGRAQ